MQRALIRYGLAFTLALLASVPPTVALFAGWHAGATAAFWLSLFTLEWLLVEPSVHSGESFDEARLRVRRSIARDPVCWAFALAAVFALLRWINGGIAVEYDPETSSWAVSTPVFAGLPTAAGGSGRTLFAVALTLALVAASVRNALGKSARSMFVLVASVVSGLGGIAAGVCVCLGRPELLAAAGRGLWSASFAGDAFSVWSVLSVCSICTCESLGWRRGGLFVAFLALMGNAVGLVFLAPSLVALGAFAAMALVALPGLVYAGSVSGMTGSLRALVASGLAVSLALVALSGAAPKAVANAKFAAVSPANALPAKASEMRSALTLNAHRVWLSRPWLGGGAGAYAMHAPYFADPADWEGLPPKIEFSPNGYMQILAERGIVGCGLVLALLALMAVSTVARASRAIRRLLHESDAPSVPAAFPPVAWCPLFLVPALAAETWFTCSPVNAPGMWAAAGCALLAASAAFPAVAGPVAPARPEDGTTSEK